MNTSNDKQQPYNPREPKTQISGATERKEPGVPWVWLLVVGLFAGTIVGRLIDDIPLGTSWGLVGAVVVASFWSHFLPIVRRLLPWL